MSATYSVRAQRNAVSLARLTLYYVNKKSKKLKLNVLFSSALGQNYCKVKIPIHLVKGA